MTKRAIEKARSALTRDLIVQAAITLVEREGARALTMRKVAAELGVGTMSLYNHVSDRDTLVECLAQAVLGEFDVLAAAPAPADWREGARALVAAFRAAARRHPRTMHLVLTSRLDLEFPWRTAEMALALLTSAGFDGETSVRALRTLMAFAIGAQMMENGAIHMTGQVHDPAFEVVQADLDRFPHVVAAADELVRTDLRPDFAVGLEMLLAALDRMRPSGAS